MGKDRKYTAMDSYMKVITKWDIWMENARSYSVKTEDSMEK